MATVGESKERQTKKPRPPRDFDTISPPKTLKHWAYVLPLFYMTNHSHLNSSNLSLKCESSTSLYLYRCYQPTGQATWFHHAVKKTFNPRIYYTWIQTKSPQSSQTKVVKPHVGESKEHWEQQRTKYLDHQETLTPHRSPTLRHWLYGPMWD